MYDLNLPVEKVFNMFTGLEKRPYGWSQGNARLTDEAYEQLAPYQFVSWCVYNTVNGSYAHFAFRRDDPIPEEVVMMWILQG